MEKHEKEVLWIAVKVWRGFPDEVRGFKRKSDAENQKRKWLKTMNPDYDESEVLPLLMGEG
ncbi:MAG: hypothetical protein HY790_03735 [Deltaproteobacteria bacterium]|nr:hypothetical protein [Deltaproteobacteria bacterium]MBI4794942.1 hypothetical protein [Deltaproteobacteria bacterium]